MRGAAIRGWGAGPWLRGAHDYGGALAAGSAGRRISGGDPPSTMASGASSASGYEPLRGPAGPSPWDSRLAEPMEASGRAGTGGRPLPVLLAERADPPGLR